MVRATKNTKPKNPNPTPEASPQPNPSLSVVKPYVSLRPKAGEIQSLKLANPVTSVIGRMQSPRNSKRTNANIASIVTQYLNGGNPKAIARDTFAGPITHNVVNDDGTWREVTSGNYENWERYVEEICHQASRLAGGEVFGI